MTRRVAEKLCTKKVCVDFLAPYKTFSQMSLMRACKMQLAQKAHGNSLFAITRGRRKHFLFQAECFRGETIFS